MDKKKILLVDDEADFVDATRFILETKGGYAVVVAYDGVEGIEKTKLEKPDLIVLDVMMPNKHGYKMCEELKASEEYRDIPIVLLTSVASHVKDTKYTHSMGMETEADDYIEKPVKPEELLKTVNFHLSKK
ncbi:MAG: response regulator [Deltaproteobacteria bacterium]|nr:response regulator [Deltaproteobacteria bacterium]